MSSKPNTKPKPTKPKPSKPATWQNTMSTLR